MYGAVISHTLVLHLQLRMKKLCSDLGVHRVQELCESQGGRPGLSVLTSLMVSVDVKQY